MTLTRLASQVAPHAASRSVRREGLSVFVRGLTIDAEIGVYAHEHGRRQPLVVEAELTLGEGRIETLADTVNYEIVVERARALAEAGHVKLVEEYAERLALWLMDDPRVLRARVRVDKPEALDGADAAGCEVVFVRD